MKRPTYTITAGSHTTTKNSWNAALKEARALVRGMLSAGEKSAMFLGLRDVERLDPWTHKAGTAVYRTDAGREITIQIRLTTPTP